MGYEGGNVPKEMADCAMADILSTFRRAAFGFCGVERKEKRTFVSLFRVFSVFFCLDFLDENFSLVPRETLKSQKETENSHSSTPHNNNIIIIR